MFGERVEAQVCREDERLERLVRNYNEEKLDLVGQRKTKPPICIEIITIELKITDTTSNFRVMDPKYYSQRERERERKRKRERERERKKKEIPLEQFTILH